jgi:acetyl-CoA acetyltransferase
MVRWPRRPPSSLRIADELRFGRYGGAPSGVRPDDLAAHVFRALLDRAPALDPERIDDIGVGRGLVVVLEG